MSATAEGNPDEEKIGAFGVGQLLNLVYCSHLLTLLQVSIVFFPLLKNLLSLLEVRSVSFSLSGAISF